MLSETLAGFVKFVFSLLCILLCMFGSLILSIVLGAPALNWVERNVTITITVTVILIIVSAISFILYIRARAFQELNDYKQDQRLRIQERKEARRAHEQLMVDLSLTCRRCGKLARPVEATANRYRCEGCGKQFVGARHKM